MRKPVIAIVGRPNVGKSMLFNRLIGRKQSIVEDTPGVTRDRIYAEGEWRGRVFELIDTGGIEPKTDNEILKFMREQALIAIDTADVIIFITDVRTGITAADQDVAAMTNNDMLVVHTYAGTANTAVFAVRYSSCMVKPSGLGGSSNVGMPIDVTFGGTRTKGTAAVNAGVVTFSAEE